MDTMNYQWVVGIDEAGRGPIAGPVAVGAVSWKLDDRELLNDLARIFPIVKDSKQLSEKRREALCAAVVDCEQRTTLRYSVALVAPSYVDTHGIVPSIHRGVASVLAKVINDSHDVFVMLDGGLKAPQEYIHQKTCIKGDTMHAPIALASIVAKVLRDRYMVRVAQKYPGYGFEKHKGYGTKAHYEALRRLGVTEIHRKSFLASF